MSHVARGPVTWARIQDERYVYRVKRYVQWLEDWTGEAGLDEVSRMGQGTFTQHALAPRRNLFDGH